MNFLTNILHFLTYRESTFISQTDHLLPLQPSANLFRPKLWKFDHLILLMNMTMMKGSTLCLFLVLHLSVAMTFNKYKSCLYECLNCVNTWGKQLFDGEKCADGCAESQGESRDESCMKYIRVGRGRRGLGSGSLQEADSDRKAANSPAYLPYRRTGPRFGLERINLAGQVRTSQDASLPAECQQLCKTKCEPLFTLSMDAHTCMYTCISNNRRKIVC